MKRFLLLPGITIIFCLKLNAQALTAYAGPDTGRVDCYGQTALIIGGSPTASGGTPPYTYLWSPQSYFLVDSTSANPFIDYGQVTQPDSDMLFTVLVTDGLGDTATDQVLIYAHPASISTLADTTGCLGEINSFSAVNYGTPPYSYHWWWSDGDTSIMQNVSHTYVYIGGTSAELAFTDAHSCTRAWFYANVYGCGSLFVMNNTSLPCAGYCFDGTA